MNKFVIIIVLFATNAFCASNYYTGTDIIDPSPSALSVGDTYTDTTTGATVERRTLNTTLLPEQPSSSMIVYSRFSALNSNGTYFVVHGVDSTSAWIVRESDNVVLHKVNPGSGVGAANDEIGEAHEIRWDNSGSYPNRIYFVYGMKFWMMDVIDGNDTSTLVHDFSTEYPAGVKILNDVEGDSSADSRYWAWQVLGEYTTTTVIPSQHYKRIAIITYDKTTDTVLGDILPGDVTPTANEAGWAAELPIPNMVEISPNGDRLMTNYSRCYTGSPTQDFCSTELDGAWVWNLDISSQIKVGITETHSGWGFKNGKQLFVHHMNRPQGSVEDTLQACYTDGTGGAYPDNCFNIMKFADHNYLGQHLTRMPSSKPGWIIMSTYMEDYPAIERDTAYSLNVFKSLNGYQYKATVGGTTASSTPTFPTTTGATVADGTVTWTCRGRTYLNNQVLGIELKDYTDNPRIWRISPTYNDYLFTDADRYSAALSFDGDSVYWTSNWNAHDGTGEVYSVDLPSNWTAILDGAQPLGTVLLGQ